MGTKGHGPQSEPLMGGGGGTWVLTSCSGLVPSCLGTLGAQPSLLLPLFFDFLLLVIQQYVPQGKDALAHLWEGASRPPLHWWSLKCLWGPSPGVVEETA